MDFTIVIICAFVVVSLGLVLAFRWFEKRFGAESHDGPRMAWLDARGIAVAPPSGGFRVDTVISHRGVPVRLQAWRVQQPNSIYVFNSVASVEAPPAPPFSYEREGLGSGAKTTVFGDPAAMPALSTVLARIDDIAQVRVLRSATSVDVSVSGDVPECWEAILDAAALAAR